MHLLLHAAHAIEIPTAGHIVGIPNIQVLVRPKGDLPQVQPQGCWALPFMTCPQQQCLLNTMLQTITLCYMDADNGDSNAH